MTDEEYKILKEQFTIVSDWLKYAESKNATLTAFNGAAIFGILQSIDKIPSWFSAITVALLLVSTLITTFSFLPRLNNKFSTRKIPNQEFQSTKNNINHIFFGDIKKLDSTQLSELLNERYQNMSFNHSDLGIYDWLNQIIVNSEIAAIKHIAFVFAIRTSMLSIIVGIIYISVRLIGYFDKIINN
ncbi:Pycsar system effector family protein [Larkinella sp. C7]|uniref:Pycsar system effector family protein n=1 Tax=Larkinella sp. C7 TaxID=2576607 RepID=UPI00111142A0|nr:Pycsar system effector family protein [Larkinella sp. C7]